MTLFSITKSKIPQFSKKKYLFFRVEMKTQLLILKNRATKMSRRQCLKYWNQNWKHLGKTFLSISAKWTPTSLLSTYVNTLLGAPPRAFRTAEICKPVTSLKLICKLSKFSARILHQFLLTDTPEAQSDPKFENYFELTRALFFNSPTSNIELMIITNSDI